MSSIPLFLFLFLLQNLPTTSFALLIKEKRERQIERERGERLGDQRSPCRRRSSFTMPSEIGIHHALSRPPSHRRSSSSPPPGWVRSACSFFFFFFFIFACSNSTLFYKNWNFFCVMCLDYVRNGVRSVCYFFFLFFFFFFFIFASSDSTLF